MKFFFLNFHSLSSKPPDTHMGTGLNIDNFNIFYFATFFRINMALNLIWKVIFFQFIYMKYHLKNDQVCTHDDDGNDIIRFFFYLEIIINDDDDARITV